MPFA